MLDAKNKITKVLVQRECKRPIAIAPDKLNMHINHSPASYLPDVISITGRGLCVVRAIVCQSAAAAAEEARHRVGYSTAAAAACQRSCYPLKDQPPLATAASPEWHHLQGLTEAQAKRVITMAWESTGLRPWSPVPLADSAIYHYDTMVTTVTSTRPWHDIPDSSHVAA